MSNGVTDLIRMNRYAAQRNMLVNNWCQSATFKILKSATHSSEIFRADRQQFYVNANILRSVSLLEAEEKEEEKEREGKAKICIAIRKSCFVQIA